MKRILLTRHAKTEPFQFSKPDFERQLVSRGFKDIDLVSKCLIDEGLIPERIYYSPAMRTSQTADRFAQHFIAQRDEGLPLSTVENLYMASLEDIDELIFGLPEDLDTVMIIGHNPSMMDYLMCTGAMPHMPTAATAILTADVNKWPNWSMQIPKMEKYISPKMLK